MTPSDTKIEITLVELIHIKMFIKTSFNLELKYSINWNLSMFTFQSIKTDVVESVERRLLTYRRWIKLQKIVISMFCSEL